MLRPWGVRGEVKVELLSSNAEALAAGRPVYVGDETRPRDVQSMRVQGRSLVVKLQGSDTPEQAEELRDQILRIAFVVAAPLQPNQYYHYQIIGLSVVTLEGEELGRITEIIETGANDVYVAQGPRGEVLLPARIEIVKQIDLDAGRMVVAPPPGLLE